VASLLWLGLATSGPGARDFFEQVSAMLVGINHSEALASLQQRPLNLAQRLSGDGLEFMPVVLGEGV